MSLAPSSWGYLYLQFGHIPHQAKAQTSGCGSNHCWLVLVFGWLSCQLLGTISKFTKKKVLELELAPKSLF
jgi:hypothetical protein